VVADDVHDELGGILPGARRRTLAVRGRGAAVPVLVAEV
jgi:hypothetical protein